MRESYIYCCQCLQYPLDPPILEYWAALAIILQRYLLVSRALLAGWGGRTIDLVCWGILAHVFGACWRRVRIAVGHGVPFQGGRAV